jgi:heme-degrading monooxygenase HmoA
MIARIWRGTTRAAQADEYQRYLERTGLAEYAATEGNKGVIALRRINGDRAEFFLLTLWESMDAVRRFAGDDVEQAVFYAEDEEFLIDKDTRVVHYDVMSAKLESDG